MWNQQKALNIAQSVANWIERYKQYPQNNREDKALGYILCGLTLQNEKMFFNALTLLEIGKNTALELGCQKIIEAVYSDNPNINLDTKEEKHIDRVMQLELDKIFEEERQKLEKTLEHCEKAGEYCIECGWQKHCKYKNKLK